jgi:hypothetical protein
MSDRRPRAAAALGPRRALILSPVNFRLGRYELLRELGRGGTSVVYLARDGLIGRLVALKVFPADRLEEQSDPGQFRMRLLREAESAGRLSHPAIVTVHDVAVGGVGEPAYIAMEYVEGETLKERLRRGERLTPAGALDVVAQVAAALDHAHAQGVVHRDVKPANLLLTPGGRVKITDFGVAHLSSSDLTHEGEVLGTPWYMPPEQVQGRPLDQRADVFALGAVACEMLAGRPPAAAGSLASAVHELVSGNLDLSPGALNLPAPICRVLARAMARAPEVRQQSAGEFAADLRRAVAEALGSDDGETQVIASSARPGGRPLLPARLRAALGLTRSRLRLPRAGRRNAALGLLLLAGLGAGSWLMAARIPEPADPAPLGRTRQRYLELLTTGDRLLRDGRPVAALRRLERAEQLVPGSRGVRNLRQALLEAVRREEVGAHLAEVRAALERGSYGQAMAAAEALLRLGPGEAETRALLAEMEAALGRRPVPAPPPVPAPEVPPWLEPAAGPSPNWSVLEVGLQSALRRGVLVLYVGERRLLALDLEDLPPADAPQAVSHLVPAGESRLRVYVTPPRQPARLAIVDAALPGGAARTLRVSVTATGEVSAWLL